VVLHVWSQQADASTAAAQLVVPPITEIQRVNALWRWNYTAVWNETQPYYKDPVQRALLAYLPAHPLTAEKVYDCWLPAASIAVTWVNPDWVSRLFFYTDGSPMYGGWYPAAEWAQVQLWDPAYSNGTRHNFTVNVFNKSLTEDVPGGNWWHSALTQGFSQMGQLPIDPAASEQSYRIYGIHHNNGSFWHNNGIPAVAMAMLTGFSISIKTKGDYAGGVAEWFDAVKHARESPVVVTTVAKANITETDPVIHGNHAYAVLIAEQGDKVPPYPNGTQPGEGKRWARRMLMRNPWGSQDWYNAEDVWENLNYLNHLADFEKLEWAE